MARVFRLPGQAPCPACGTRLDGAGVASGFDNGQGPGVGDFTVCAECLTVLRYAPKHRYVIVSPEQVEALDPTMRRIVRQGLAFAAGMRALKRQGSN